MERFIIGCQPVGYVIEGEDKKSVLTGGHVYPVDVTGGDFPLVVSEMVRSYHYLDTAVVEKAKKIIEELKSSGKWDEKCNCEQSTSYVVSRPDLNVPYDVRLDDGVVKVGLLLTRKLYIVEHEEKGLEAQCILMSLTKPLSQRCKEQSSFPPHLPFQLRTVEFKKEAESYLADLHDLDLKIALSADEIADIFEKGLGDLYREHVKQYGDVVGSHERQ